MTLNEHRRLLREQSTRQRVRHFTHCAICQLRRSGRMDQLHAVLLAAGADYREHETPHPTTKGKSGHGQAH